VLEITEVLDPGHGARAGRPIPADSLSNDRWFQHSCLVVNAMEAALAALQPAFAAGRIQPISSAPQRLPDWNTAAAGIVAYKFCDPEGHPLELLQFPPDKGEARWHVQALGPLLGIDHNAGIGKFAEVMVWAFKPVTNPAIIRNVKIFFMV
jgi:hypothetical protein